MSGRWGGKVRPMVMALLLVGGLAACGGDDDASDPDEPTESGGEDAVAAEWAEFQSPLAEFLGQPTFTPGDNDAVEEIALQEQEAGNLITECMAEQGFEYRHADSRATAFIAGDEDAPWGSRAWTEVYGFGVTTMLFPESSVAPEAVGFSDEAMTDEDFEDPNADYVASLSDAERRAYEEALHGDFPAFDDTMTEAEMDEAMADFVPTGCQTEAYETVFGGGGDGFYSTFEDELTELYDRMEADPRFVEAQAEVEACVVEQGLDYVSEEDAWELYGEQADALQTAVYNNPSAVEPPPESENWTEAEWAEWSESQGPEAFAPTLTAEQKAELAALQADEIETALAVFDCGGGWANQAELYQELVVEYETQFLEENADRLAEFEGSMSTGG